MDVVYNARPAKESIADCARGTIPWLTVEDSAEDSAWTTPGTSEPLPTNSDDRRKNSRREIGLMRWLTISPLPAVHQVAAQSRLCYAGRQVALLRCRRRSRRSMWASHR